MRKTTFHSHSYLTGQHTRIEPTGTHRTAAEQLDAAIDQFNGCLQDLERRCHGAGCDLDALTIELTNEVHRFGRFCRELEDKFGSVQALRDQQMEFRQRTDAFFLKSYLMKRARTWPRGYPGDYEVIEAVYNRKADSPGIGLLLDRYFLNTTLARAVQLRCRKMRDAVAEELRRRRPGAEVLNVGCGPCREVLELAPLIKKYKARFTNIDFDTDALLFSANRLNNAGLTEYVRFRQYNALRMVNAKKNVREFGRADVIYTIGLLDYLSDDVLLRLLNALHATLKPGGVLIAVFKDCQQYDTFDYHWLVDWSAFLQRTASESRALLGEAGIAAEAITSSRTPDQVMVFYRAVQTADMRAHSLAGPHDRRQLVDPGNSESASNIRSERPKRPSWRRPEQTR